MRLACREWANEGHLHPPISLQRNMVIPSAVVVELKSGGRDFGAVRFGGCVCRCLLRFKFPSHYRPSTIATMPNIRVLRDIKARELVRANEVARRAYLYVARNQALPPQVRHQAQLQLNTFGRYTRPTTVKNRCHETGRGRGIMSEFGLCRVRASVLIFSIRY